jgi:hypothetical protein
MSIPNGIVALQVIGLRPAEISAAPDHLFLQSPERYEFVDITDLTKRYVISLATGQYVPFGGGGVPITVGGTFAVGGTLTATFSPGWSATGLQWLRNGSPIAGATAASYGLTTADAGTSIDCVLNGPIYRATGGPVAGGTGVVIYDGGDSTSTYPGDAVSGGLATVTYTLPPISGGTA